MPMSALPVGQGFEYLLIYSINYLITTSNRKLDDLPTYMRKYLAFQNAQLQARLNPEDCYLMGIIAFMTVC